MATISRPKKGTSSVGRLILFSILVLIGVFSFLMGQGENSNNYPLLLTGTSPTSSSSASPPLDPKYRLAYEESFGFFDDIPEDNWLRRKKIAQNRVHVPNREELEKGRDPKRETYTAKFWDARWHDTSYEPDFSCDFEDTVGSTTRDGRKWVCDVHRIAARKDCLVYSVGSNGDFTFEVGVEQRAPNCEIHTFDVKDFSQKKKEYGANRTNLHVYGLKSSYETNPDLVVTRVAHQFGKLKGSRYALKTLQEIRKELGHENRTIDLFKIDCEACEWVSYKDWLDDIDIRQLLVEVHEVPLIVYDFFEALHKHGFVVFHKEHNAQWSGGNCVEYSFLRLSPNFTKNH